MAGAYTLAKNAHVRGDVLYGFFRPRTQASIDLVLYVVLPVIWVAAGLMVGNAISFVLAAVLGYWLLRRRIGALDLTREETPGRDVGL